MKVSVVISIKNRLKLFKQSLQLWQKQIMPKKDFELIVVDDSSEENIKELLKSFSGMNITYVKINSKLIGYPIFWGPSISNNIGFKLSQGEVIMITGPEILHKETNLIYGYETAMNDKIAYGHVYHSGPRFPLMLNNLSQYTFNDLLKKPDACIQDITKDTFYWFICAAKKEHIMKINGCDEEYMKGICGDDDDFANRIDALGVKKTHDFRIEGIHQNHTIEDSKDHNRKRKSYIWEKARLLNTKYLEEWSTLRNRTPYANINKEWGSSCVILDKEVICQI